MNKKYKITPKSITKPVRKRLIDKPTEDPVIKMMTELNIESLTPMDKKILIKNLQKEMVIAASELNFELAIEIREKIAKLK